jgi:hypothetical protein
VSSRRTLLTAPPRHVAVLHLALDEVTRTSVAIENSERALARLR